MRVKKVLAAAFVLLGMCGVCIAQETAPPPAKPPAEKTAPKQPAKPATAATQKPQAKPAASPKRPTRFDVELTGVKSELTDQVYSRILYTRRNGPHQLSIRAGYGATLTRTYSKNKVNDTELDTTTLDAQYRRDRKQTYNFITANAYVRNRSPRTTTYGELSGYYMVSAGVGRKLMPGLEGEFAIANVNRYTPGTPTQILPAYTLRLKTPLTDSLTLDGESNIVEPFSNSTIVDSRLNLTYKFNPALSLRMSYIANNLNPSPTSKTDWDRTFRVSLVFTRSTQ